MSKVLALTDQMTDTQPERLVLNSHYKRDMTLINLSVVEECPSPTPQNMLVKKVDTGKAVNSDRIKYQIHSFLSCMSLTDPPPQKKILSAFLGMCIDVFSRCS